MNLLRLIRFPNLIMLAVVQILLRYTLVIPLLVFSQKYILVTTFDFILMVLSTLLVAAGGYVINDIEDQVADSINKPEKVIVGEKISVSAAYKIYYALTLLGVALGFYLQFYRPLQYIGYTQLLSAGLLYFYTITYKGVMLLGNFIISILTASSIVLIIITEPLALSDPTILTISVGYFVFAFLMNFIREIIKDIEDMDGDAVAGFKTLPVVMGIGRSKLTAIIFSVITLLLLTYVQVIAQQWQSLIPFLYVVLLIQIPLLLLLFLLVKAKEKKNFRTLSLLAKVIMASGIFSMLVFSLSYK